VVGVGRGVANYVVIGTISANNMATTQRVQVFVRTRPTPDFAMDSIAIDDKEISIHAHNQADCKFNVDGVLHNSSQEEVYSSCGESVVTHALNGINGTIFAYGQTGAGKTYTMCGESQYRLRGIIPRAIAQIFKEVWEKDDCSIIVRISCLEIYNETLTDLLLALPDDGNRKSNSSTLAVEGNNKDCCVKGLTVKVAENEEEAMNMFFEAEKNRLIGQHHLNKQSSRSHVIFTIYLEVHSRTNASSEFTVSKLNLIDLAGSERLRKTESSGVLMKEAIYINKSLSFLEQVVIALADRHRTHIPYRHSQLTRIIKDSIGGNCNTVMIANVCGETTHIDNTIATLRFANRIMCVVASPIANVHYNPMV
jgi:kinesin family protein 6/9